MEVLQDNQADISIVRPDLLRSLRETTDTVRVNGVGGVQIELRKAGYLQDFFEVYASEDTRVNILSFSEVEEMYPITYVPYKGFIVHLPDRDILFKRHGKMHVADFAVDGHVMAMQAYTKGEIERASKVMEPVRTCGCPSLVELSYMLRW
jgi:hypothetical protein